MEPIVGVYTGEGVVVPVEGEADSLLQGGFGYRRGRTHFLRSVEALFLVDRGRVQVLDEATREPLSLKDLLNRFIPGDPEVWNRFLVYRDLRIRGYVVEVGEKGLLVYERGEYRRKPPSYLVRIIDEGRPITSGELLDELANLGEGVSLKLAVVDRRGEVVYYSADGKDF